MLHIEMPCANKFTIDKRRWSGFSCRTGPHYQSHPFPSSLAARPSSCLVYPYHTHTHALHTTHGTTEAASRTTTSHTATKGPCHGVAHAASKILVASKVPTTSSHVAHATTATSIEAALHAAATPPPCSHFLLSWRVDLFSK